MKANTERRYFSTGWVARHFGVDRSTVWRWEQAGIIRPVQHTAGGQARWDLEQVREQAAAARRRGAL